MFLLYCQENIILFVCSFCCSARRISFCLFVVFVVLPGEYHSVCL